MYGQDSDESRSTEEEGEENEGTTVSSTNEKFIETGDPCVYLTFEEASKCLCMLGKNDSGLKYSYLMMNASEKSLTDIRVIPTFRNVLFVDVSGNRLTQSSLKILTSMTYLLMLKADRNRIESPEMEPMFYLQVLSMNRNGITETSGISHRLLECLELNYNKITSVSLNPYILDNLKVLELRGNMLKTTNGIFFPSLVSLYVADNEIENIEGFEMLVNLKTFHARNNKISILDGLNTPKCSRLSYLNLRNNRIRTFSEIGKLRNLLGLETLIISQNPFFTFPIDEDNDENTEKQDEYKIKIISLLRNLKRINKDPILDEERDAAKELREDGTISFSDADIENEDE